MREAFKAQVEIDGRWFLIPFFYQVSGFHQSFFLQPLPGSHAEYFLKVALEPRKASARELRKFFNRDIEMKIAEHEFFQIHFIRLRKIE